MVQKKFLIIVNLMILGSIFFDLYESNKISHDNKLKVEYLSSVYSSSIFERISTEIKKKSRAKKSLNVYKERLLKLESLSKNFKDSIHWNTYFDKPDLKTFAKKIYDIPTLEQYENTQLTEHRNKIIFKILLDYLSGKVTLNGSGCHFSKYYLIKDVTNNLSMIDNSNYNKVEITNINNQVNFKYLNEQLFRVPLADSLKIGYITYHNENYYPFLNVDSLINYIEIDIKNISAILLE